MISEHTEQVSFFKELCLEFGSEIRALVYAIPNAGKRSRGAMYYYIAEGLSVGIPDLCVPIARHGYGALYIEMKNMSKYKRTGEFKNQPSPSQEIKMKLLEKFGNKVVCCHGCQEAISQIRAYLKD